MAVPRVVVRLSQWSFSCALVSGLMLSSVRADWNQWRGTKRDGATTATDVRAELPKTGLKPLWKTEDNTGSGGGWSSPIIADGMVFQYFHDRDRREGVELPPEKYPSLTDEQKTKLSEEERKSYEEKRSQEQQDRRDKQFVHRDRVMCLDAKTGKPIWEHTRESESTRWRQSSTPVVSAGNLYYIGADRKLVCLNIPDKSQTWAVAIPIEAQSKEGNPDPISSSPLVTDGRVIVLADRLIAFDKADGSVEWTSEAKHDGVIYSSPAVWHSPSGPRIVANVGDEGTICVEAATGRELWRVESHAGRSSPVIQGDTLLTYGGSRKGGLRRYEMKEDGAELKWTSHRFADQGSSPVIAAGRVFVQSSRDLACVDLEDGATLWKVPLKGDNPRYTSPIAVGDHVFYTFGGVLGVPAKAEEPTPTIDARINEDGLLASEDYFREKLKLDSLSNAEAEKVWQRQIESQGPERCVSPALVDGRLYLRLNRGLVCYDLSSKLSK